MKNQITQETINQGDGERKVSKIQDLTLADVSCIKFEQLVNILQKTPKQHIFTRKGKSGKDFEYITGTYAKKVLNYAFGWLWDFEVKKYEIIDNQIIVIGKLVIKRDNISYDTQSMVKLIELGMEAEEAKKLCRKSTIEVMMSKEQAGRCDIKFLKDKSGKVDVGNDIKGAITDCLKKCASELGVASDVYGKKEFKEIETESKAKNESKKQSVKIETLIEKIKICKTIKGLNEWILFVGANQFTDNQKNVLLRVIEEQRKYAN